MDGATVASAASGSNNSVAVGGYDAYFGTYTVDEVAGTVTQHLLGALSPGDVGKVVTRELRIEGDRLTIELVTSGADGEPLTRTLIWVARPEGADFDGLKNVIRPMWHPAVGGRYSATDDRLAHAFGRDVRIDRDLRHDGG